eukprot:5994943-Pyramimonas_sp.AAC.1
MCDVFKQKPQPKLVQNINEMKTAVAVVVASSMVVEACMSADSQDGVKLRALMNKPKTVLRTHKVQPELMPPAVKASYLAGMAMAFEG